MTIAKNTGQLLRGSEASVYDGTAGAVATDPLSYFWKDEVVRIAISEIEEYEARVQGIPQGIEDFSHGLKAEVTIPIAQFNAELIARAFGLSAAAGVVTLGDPSTFVTMLPKKSIAVVATDFDGNPFRFDGPYGTFKREWAVDLGEGQDKQGWSMVWRSKHGGTFPTITSSDISTTLATGVLTRTKAVHQVKGEGNVADTLTSISGGSVGDTLRIYPYTAAYNVGITHGVNIILFGAASWTDFGESLADFIDLKKTGATEWTEERRNDPV